MRKGSRRKPYGGWRLKAKDGVIDRVWNAVY